MEQLAPERCFTQLGSGLTCKQKTKLERFARDKRSSLLQKFVTCGIKKFDNIGPRGLASQSAQKFDQFLTTEVTHYLFAKSSDQFLFGEDLVPML